VTGTSGFGKGLNENVPYVPCISTAVDQMLDPKLRKTQTEGGTGYKFVL